MSHHWPDGEGPSDRGHAKQRADDILADPKHHRAKGHPDDEATRDDDIEDPTKQKKEH